MQEIHLSVVAGSRNDDHGENLVYRMQQFSRGFIEQCKRHQLRAELILVEWNPPEGKPFLEEALNIPKNTWPCDVRIIQVPKEIHATFEHSEKLPMFQMIAKNVGIRRARGKFVLATNIDVLFSDDVIVYLRDHLRENIIYRADRFDVPSELPSSSSFEPILDFCKKTYFRIHSREGSLLKIDGKWVKENPMKSKSFWDFIIHPFLQIKQDFLRMLNLIRKMKFKFKHPLKICYFVVKFPSKIIKKIFISLKILVRYYLSGGYRLLERMFKNKFFKKTKWKYIPKPHTNACGDFTLMSLKDWLKLKGYPEWALYSWHIDSVLVYQAIFHNLKLKTFSKKKHFYHIEHGKGSGFTPEYANLLFERLRQNQIPYLNYSELLYLVDEMREQTEHGDLPLYNTDMWGLSQHDLKEVLL